MNVDVSIIISNRNGREYLRGCLESLHAGGKPKCATEIFVADNGSTDGSPDMVEQEFPNVKLVAHGEDLGFTRSNNKVVSQSSGRYLVLLNNDTVVLPRAIDELVELMDANPYAGGVGIRLFYADGREQFSGRRFPSKRNGLFGRTSLMTRLFPNNRWSRDYLYADELKEGEPFQVDWLSHAGAMYRRSAFDDANGLDETMYYWHEAMIALEMQRLGWETYLHPASRAIHYEGQGSGHRDLRSRVRHHFDFAKGSHVFHCRHHGLGEWNPRRLVSWLGLNTRAAILSFRELFRNGESQSFEDGSEIEKSYSKLVHKLVAQPNAPSTLMFTSVDAGEGVSATVAAVGQQLALGEGASTLLIDANFSEPGLHDLFLIDNKVGFSEIVTGKSDDIDGTVRDLGGKLAVVPHGSTYFGLNSPKAQAAFETGLSRLATLHRFTLIDAPPLNSRPDVLAMAPSVDAVILVVRADGTSQDDIESALANLTAAGANVLGAIYNGKVHHIPQAIYSRV